ANLSVRENLQMGAYLQKNRSEIAAVMERVFQMFPRLKERESQKAGTLSGGEQQMLAMSRALMSRPRLLLLDEPSLGLAPLVVHTIFQVLAATSAQMGRLSDVRKALACRLRPANSRLLDICSTSSVISCRI